MPWGFPFPYAPPPDGDDPVPPKPPETVPPPGAITLKFCELCGCHYVNGCLTYPACQKKPRRYDE